MTFPCLNLGTFALRLCPDYVCEEIQSISAVRYFKLSGLTIKLQKKITSELFLTRFWRLCDWNKSWKPCFKFGITNQLGVLKNYFHGRGLAISYEHWMIDIWFKIVISGQYAKISPYFNQYLEYYRSKLPAYEWSYQMLSFDIVFAGGRRWDGYLFSHWDL